MRKNKIIGNKSQKTGEKLPGSLGSLESLGNYGK
jgi:hypothetical protein